MTSLPPELYRLSNLQHLNVIDCHDFSSLRDMFSTLSSLQKLEVVNSKILSMPTIT